MPRSYHPKEDRHVRRETKSARSMIVIHTRLRSATSSIGGTRPDQKDLFPSIADLAEAKQRRQGSSSHPNSRRSRTKRSAPVRKRLQSGSAKVNPAENNLSDRSMQSVNVSAAEEDERRASIDQLQETLTKTKKRKRYPKCCGPNCSPLCVLASILGPLLLATLLATLLVAFLPRTTTTTRLTSKLTQIATNATTITSTSTTTVTTTTQVVCAAITCVNQSWVTDESRLARWNFDNNLLDNVSNAAASSTNTPSYLPSYLNQAMTFPATANQSVTTTTLNLTDSSFTVDAWIFPTALPNAQDHSIFGLCPLFANLECLYLTIRLDSSGLVPFFGLRGYECPGSTIITAMEWVHIAFAFELSSYTQSIYVNGKLDLTCTASGPFKANPSVATIGHVPLIDSPSGYNHFQGLIDRLTVTGRDKAPCELLEEATLMAYFSFDTGVQYTDMGPNALSATAQALSSVASGHKQQALSFSRSASSYLQIAGVSNLGISHRPFSNSLWVRPRSLSGVIVHVSSNAVGTGWCLPFLGFASNGSVVAQILNGAAVRWAVGPSIPVNSSWTHIVQTWGPVNGVRLYVNNVLVGSIWAMAGSYTASSLSNFVLLGDVRSGTTCAPGFIGSLTGFDGDMDEFRIYSRELTADDICTLYRS